MTTVREVLDDKGTAVHTTNATSTVIDAVDAMCRARVGALLVCDEGHPIGIFSERDVLTRVVLARRDPATTRVGEVMTYDLVTVDGSTRVAEAMRTMTDRRVRHLPVVERGRVLGIVSIGDLVRLHAREEQREIDALIEFVRGTVPPLPPG